MKVWERGLLEGLSEFRLAFLVEVAEVEVQVGPKIVQQGQFLAS